MTKNLKNFFVKIILPSLLTICLFVVLIFAVLIPRFEENSLERKREMIQELTNSAWSILVELENEEKLQILSRSEAQQRAISQIEYLRYGKEAKDYFWITDMSPQMIMHPFRKELNGTDLSNYKDSHGKKLFLSAIETVQENGHGYIDYMWQWKDDSSRIVPKLSYVKGFEPWGWIVGTGIYIEDVKQEISLLKSNIIKISLIIIAAIASIMIFIIQQSLKLENRKEKAEIELLESREKYRKLVEATTEGALMVFNEKIFYSNEKICSLLDYTEKELGKLNVFEIFPESQLASEKVDKLKLALEGKISAIDFEIQLKNKSGKLIDVVIHTSEIFLAGKHGLIITTKDISKNKIIEGELDESKEKYKNLTDNLNIGVFRTTIGKNGKFIEANPAAVKILGFRNKDELFNVNIPYFFGDTDERRNFTKRIFSKGFVKNEVLHIKQKSGEESIVSVSAVLVNDKILNTTFFDGIVEDISESKRIEKEKENLIDSLQSSQLFLNQPIKSLIRNVVKCNMYTPVCKVAEIMTKKNTSSIIITTEKGDNVGIITDHDLRERVLAENFDPDLPVYKVMTSPLIWIGSNKLLFEAAFLMKEKKLRYLAVKDQNKEVVSILSQDELLNIQRNSSSFLLQEIKSSLATEDLKNNYHRLTNMLKSLISTGISMKHVLRVNAAVSDQILIRLIEIAIEEIGKPPVKFSFIALGSEGREEQTLATDQDNAIIYEDPKPETQQVCEEYFLKMGEKVCNALDEIGYKFCQGEIMAKNKKWCQPISVWKKYFQKWIIEANAPDLLQMSIFFDFRSVYGNAVYTDQLREHINAILLNRKEFFPYMAQNVIQFKMPLNFFGNIVVGTEAEHPESFDIKEAMSSLVGFVRTYSLQHKIPETNTLNRFDKLLEKQVLNQKSYDDIVQTYLFLLQMRFKHQVSLIEQGKEPNNFINPKKLSNIDVSMLKKVFAQISLFQTKLKMDYFGTA